MLDLLDDLADSLDCQKNVDTELAACRFSCQQKRPGLREENLKILIKVCDKNVAYVTR